MESDLERRVRGVLDSVHGELFLARVLLELTIAARADAYVETGNPPERSAARLREYNEKIHRIAGQLLSYRDQQKRGYPNDVFARILLDASPEIRGGVTTALEQSLRRTAG